MRMYLFVAIVIPLRSLIRPMNAYFTASVRKAASGVASRPTTTYKSKKKVCLTSRSLAHEKRELYDA